MYALPSNLPAANCPLFWFMYNRENVTVKQVFPNLRFSVVLKLRNQHEINEIRPMK